MRATTAAASGRAIRGPGGHVPRVAARTETWRRRRRRACAPRGLAGDRHTPGTRAQATRGSDSFPRAVTLYYILGIALAAWAVIVAALGIKFERFPGGRGGERVVIAVSVLLVAGTIGSAVVLSALEDAQHKGKESSEAGSGQE
jgi:hypothetical protein